MADENGKTIEEWFPDEELFVEDGYWDWLMTNAGTALANDAKNIRLWNDYARSLVHTNNVDMGISKYSKSIEVEPNNWQAFVGRGLAHAMIDKYREAIKDYTAAIQLENNLYEAFYYRGNAYAQMGEYEKAIADYKESVRQQHHKGYVHNNMGCAYLRLNELDDAIGCFKTAQRTRYGRAYYYRTNADETTQRKLERKVNDYTEYFRSVNTNLVIALGRREAQLRLNINITDTGEISKIYESEIAFSRNVLYGKQLTEQETNHGWFKKFYNSIKNFLFPTSLEKVSLRSSNFLRVWVIEIIIAVSYLFHLLYIQTGTVHLTGIKVHHIIQYTSTILFLSTPFFLHARYRIRCLEEERVRLHSLMRDRNLLLFWNAQEPDDRSSNRAKLANAMLHHIGTNSTADVSLRMMGRKRSGADEGRGDDGRLSFMESTLQDIKSQLDVIKGQQKGGD